MKRRVFLILLLGLLSACEIDESKRVDESTRGNLIVDTSDVTAPELSEISVIENTVNLNPIYTFHSTEAGRFTWVSGDCRYRNSHAVAGNNTIELYGVVVGDNSNCEFTLTDENGNESKPLTISSFTVLTSDSDSDGFADFSELEYETDPFDADSSPMGVLSDTVNFKDDNDSDGFSDQIEAWFYSDPNHPASTPVDENNDLIPDGFDSSNDTDAPRLLGFNILESSVNIETGNETLTFNMSIIDDLSGLDYLHVILYSESGHSIVKSMSGLSLGDSVRNFSLQSSEFGLVADAGAWSVTVALDDAAGNSKIYRSGDMKRMGFDDSIEVVNSNDGN